ncbi:shikimate dehydrogenase [Streptococcus sp. DD11]|uniref:shikimate dehydrogenase n=1 Tax=Streptococcus sp. DD11 TaxID=1777879 RepID=UPI001F49A6CA|nr:shikimate dehydrogenase [Streptococcus sp. DD11]
MDAVLSVRTKAVNQTSSLSEARPMVEGELRDMDTETSSVVVLLLLTSQIRSMQTSLEILMQAE